MNNKPKKSKTSSKLSELQAVKLLVVKATEENDHTSIPQLTVSNANIAAIGAKSDLDFLSRRAAYLFKHLPTSLKNITSITEFPGNWLKIILLLSFISGLLSNYLGPSKLIHVIYNPLTILLVWNFFTYMVLIIKSFLNIGLSSVEKPIKALINAFPEKKDDLLDKEEEEKKKKKISKNFILDWLLGGLFRNILTIKTKASDDTTKVAHIKKIWFAFWISYKEVAGTALIFRFKNLMNIGAIGLLIGALAGVYLRGLFFNYNMIWQSTFVSDPETISIFLNILLGPASLILDGSLINLETVESLLNPDGTSAAPWIHKLALSAFLFIFIPRTLLALGYAKLAKRKIKTIDISQDYYQAILRDTRENLINVIRDEVENIISKKIDKTAHSITNFVIDDYYEKIIVPELVAFRERGGKIRKLEKSLFKSQEEFEPILSGYLKKVQHEFKESVLTEVNLFLGRKFDIDISTSGTYLAQSDKIDQTLPSRVAEDIGDTIGGTIVTGVAVAAGSISGGLGKSLGIAIISGLLGVSGPIGLLIGSLITVAALAGIYKVGRDQISDFIKDVYLPPVVIKLALSDSKITKARQDTFLHTQNEIKKILEPKIDEVSNEILKDITY